MKQNMVVEVTMNCAKCHSKALKIAAGLPGVESASLKGDDKSQIEVSGNGVDPVRLTRRLKRRMRHAKLVSLSPVGGEKKEEKNKEEEKPAAYVWPYNPPYYVCEVPSYGEVPLYGYPQCHEPYCSIM